MNIVRKSIYSPGRVVLLGVCGSIMLLPMLNRSAAAACSLPSPDYGSVTSNVSIPSSGVYRVWSRVSVASDTATAYMLEVDGSSCYIVNGNGLPISTNGVNFVNDASNWTARTTGGSYIDVNLPAGNHSLKMIGTANGVMLDRLVLTQDKSCVPTGTGDNCASPPDTSGPVVNISSPADQATINATTTVTANAVDDDSGVKQVVFYLGSTVIGTDMISDGNHNYTATLKPTNFDVGNYTLKAVATDRSNNTSTSSLVHITIPSSGGTTPPTPKLGDINGDGVVNYLDLSALASNYNKSGSAINPPEADINGDGVVNYLDLSALASNYNK